jgi:hypothetical protein
MNRKRRFAAGAAIAGVLVTPPAALAAVSPNPAEASDGSTPAGPVTTVPLPDAVAECLSQYGFPNLSAGTTFELPAMAGAPPASLAGTIPLSGTGDPTTSGTIPLSGSGTIPLSGVGAPTTATGTNPVPTGGGATSTGAVPCGQLFINNLVYVVLVGPTTNTTTTTTANGPMTAADGPVTVTDNAPAAAPVTATDNAPAPAPATTTPVVATGKGKQKATHRRHRRNRSTARKHSTHNRARRGKLALHVVLFRKSRGDGSRRVTALAAHAGRGS